MKRLFYGILFLFFASIHAQEIINEPTFIGEAFILQDDNTPLHLEKEQVQFKTRAGVSVYLVGIGNVRTRIDIPGCCSGVVIEPKNEFKLVVRAVDNDTDPLSIIQVFKFKQRKKKRQAELASFGTFKGSSANNLDYLSFSAERYGENSYILTINNFERGEEYGVIVNNPNALNETQTIVSTFGIQ